MSLSLSANSPAGFFEVSIYSEFSAAHHLLNYSGNCSRLHGHNWKVELSVRGTQLDQSGILVDFRHMRSELSLLLQKLDHHFLNELPELEGQSPSAEVLARFIAVKMSQTLDQRDSKVVKVRVWENDRSVATYYAGTAQHVDS